ncbi:MAG: CRISPR-associated endonuclease Cas2 [Betaproteobacteria bacterium]
MNDDERLYVVTYDIGDPKRWRAVFKLMNGYGEWLQLSVFQCRLTRQRHAELVATLDLIIHHKEDHVILVDLGPARHVQPRVVSLGKASFEPIRREPVIV